MKKILGIEFGSTRIKAVLIDEAGKVLAVGGHKWENSFVDGHWSYSLDEIKSGLTSCYEDMKSKYGGSLSNIDAIGISGMMHGYMAFDKNWNLLAPFRTWRDTTTLEASEILTKELDFNIPQRWSCSHFYQAILNGESHVGNVAHLTTISGYVHFLLTGENVLGVDDASGMFPTENGDYDKKKSEKYEKLLKDKNINIKVADIFPRVLCAGENAGQLTPEGAKMLDPTGELIPGTPLCPPEGDMATGLVATNVSAPRIASMSCGTSANLTVVLEKSLTGVYPEIDIIDTPDGHPVALVHTGTCTGEIDRWIGLFKEVLNLFGADVTINEIFEKLFAVSADSNSDIGKIAAYNFLAGEPIAKTKIASPAVICENDSNLSLANFMQAEIYAAISTLRMGIDILKKENVKIDKVIGHGGYYKCGNIGQTATSAMVGAPCTVLSTADEGGAWGIALLAAYMISEKKSLPDYLNIIFKSASSSTLEADETEKQKYETFYKRYKQFLPAVREASMSQK